ncbi:hypothetical protein CCACVL1_10743 [Corchorus capsularis]|uniref:Uncharacterized protein n=1 Tax=Corchorus capsularis TaxID=210143 RepID=A0A1R3IPV4_COCAP|nr:hypothetical protein CCACVL1_10743 [Corchorus capsularis]
MGVLGKIRFFHGIVNVVDLASEKAT